MKALQFPNYLSGTAELWYNSWVDAKKAAAGAAGYTATWKDQSQAIQQAFRNVAHQEVAEDKLLARRQKIGESAEDYVYSMLDLINDFDPHMSETTKVRRIIKGLRPTYLEKINPMVLGTVNDVLVAIRKVAETQYLIKTHEDVNTGEAKVLSTLMDGFTQLFSKQTELINSLTKQNVQHPKKVRFPSSENTQYNTYRSRNHGNYTQCSTCGRLNHETKNCYKNQFCNYCQRYGHTNNYCRSGNDGGRNSNTGWNSRQTPNTRTYNNNRFQNQSKSYNQIPSAPQLSQNTA